MRCEEVIDQLPVLAYNELDSESAARCLAHLDSCAACRAEWEAIRGAMRLLDRAPRRQVQVDLAAVCLRISRQQRRSRSIGLWSVGLSAAAALVVGLFAAKLLAVDVEPGRLIVAWKSAATEPVDRDDSSAGKSTQLVGAGPTKDASPLAGPPPSPAEVDTGRAAPRGFSPSTLVLLLERDQPPAWRRQRALLAMEDANWGIASEGSSRAGRPSESDAAPSPVSYSDLRREMIENQRQAKPRSKSPGT